MHSYACFMHGEYMKKKVIAKSTRSIARLVANLDGKGKGLSQKQVETAFRHFETIEIACILGNARSLALAVRKNAVKKAKRFKR